MFPFNKHRLFFSALVFVAVTTVSCTAPKKVVYLYNLKDSTGGNLGNAQMNFENSIQKNDQLWITIGGTNIADLIIVNSASGIPAGSAGGNLVAGTNSTGYLVEADGKIKLPYLGSIQAEGLSRLQLEAFLTEKFKDYTKNPVVNVRFLNYSFSVLGEVTKPGRFNMPTERTTILEALSIAGDMNEMGKRENVLVIREVNGQRDFARINLLSKDLFKSPYYYLKTNDVIYVEPVKTRFIARTGIPQYIGIAAVGISLLITIINLSRK
ncbi:MAG: polysaccharide biosynthesis/export family protein [Ferruginibacter sp.]